MSLLRLIAPSTAFLIALAAAPVAAQTIQPPFDANYNYVDLGTVPSLPAPAGGLTFLPGDPNTLLIGGSANGADGAVYSIALTRDAANHVNGFSGTATFYADADGTSGGIDGGLAFGPAGVLFYTSYSDNVLGQIRPGSTGPDRRVALTPLGVSSSVGALAFVPPGVAGAGRMKLAQYNNPGNWYDVTLTPDGSGTYDVSATFVVAIGFGPEGIIYVGAGNPDIAVDSILVSEYSGNTVSVYESDANGDPVVATRRVFMSGLSGAEGAAIDPVTGDFLFSTFGGGNRVIVVRGFIPPPTTTSTTLATTTTSSSTSSSTATSSTSSSSSSTTVVVTTSSTSTSSSTLPPGDCGGIPTGPTFPSIACRLDELRTDTLAEPALERFVEQLLKVLDRAIERLGAAAERCDAGELKFAKAKLKKVAGKLADYPKRINRRLGRKTIPEEIREAFTTRADALREDVQTLRDTLVCPPAEPPLD